MIKEDNDDQAMNDAKGQNKSFERAKNKWIFIGIILVQPKHSQPYVVGST